MSVTLAAQSPEVLEWDTKVSTLSEDGAVLLEKSYFYPTGGGQPCDLGIISHEGKDYPVCEVRKVKGQPGHFLEIEGLKEGDKVHCQIDKERRLKHMRVHTAMHVLCAVIENEHNTQITGGQIDISKSRVDVNLENYDPEMMQKYVKEANRILQEDHPVTRKIISRQELMETPDLVKLAKGFPEHIQEIHLVRIQDVDAQPCGGTHMNNTKDIGKIVFLKAKNMGKNNRRIYFTVE